MIFIKQNLPKLFFLSIVMLLASSFTAYAAPQENPLAYLQDSENLSIIEISSLEEHAFSQINTGQALNLGYNQDRHWLKVNLAAGGWFIEIASPLLDSVILYQQNQTGQFTARHAGDNLPRSEQFNFKNPLFYIEANTPRQLFLRIESSGSVQIPLHIYTPEQFAEYKPSEEYLFGLYYGVMLVMVLFNFFLFLFVRDKEYLFYVLYIGSYIFLQASLNGYGAQYLWPNALEWIKNAPVFLINAVILSAIIFSQRFLKTALLAPRLNRLLNFVNVGALFGLLLAFIAPYYWAIQYANGLGLIMALAALSSGIYMLLHGYRSARYFVIAWLAFLIGVFVTALMYLGVLPYSPLNAYAMQIGSALEVVLLSIALADRISTLRAKKELAENLNRNLKQKNSELANLASHDGLTGLFNRNTFMQQLTLLMANAQRYEHPLTLIMIDLDHFKPVNDLYGHQMGDAVLQQVAQVLEKNKRASDMAARYGGEEFILLLPYADCQLACTVAERIRLQLQQIHFEQHPKLNISASFGVACHDPKIDRNIEDLIERADVGLYQAKHQGRNRVCIQAA
ncbi:MAG: diguanylate cyclase, partial [Gammaproteobacteria bacterium]|nr:diguanylate cyclase [Gammaproteobacteria bacterium]